MLFYLRSDHQTGYSPCSFKMPDLKQHLREGITYRVALLEFYASASSIKAENFSNMLTVTSNICGDSVIDVSSKKILRRVAGDNNGHWNMCFSRPIYLQMTAYVPQEIIIEIQDPRGMPAKFLDGPTYLTLDVEQIA